MKKQENLNKLISLILVMVMISCTASVALFSEALTYADSVELQFNEGTYYVKNNHFSLYMQLNKYAGTILNNPKGVINFQLFDGGDNQRWTFTHIGNGYYKIVSDDNGYAVTVPTGYETSGNVFLVLQPYDRNNDNQKWKITLTANGSYKIKAKSSESYTAKDLVMGLYYDQSLNIDFKLQQKEFASQIDKWIFEPLDDYNFELMGVTNSGHDHMTVLELLLSELNYCGYNNISIRTGAIHPTDCKQYLQECSIFTSRSHGFYRCSTNRVYCTGIQLNDRENIIGRYAIASDNGFSMPQYTEYLLSDEDYSNVNIAMFIGCNTGFGGVGSNNLPSKIVSLGAKAAIGFEESITCGSSNEWTMDLYELLLQGVTLSDAISELNKIYVSNAGLKSVIICGDENITLSK